MPDFTRGYNERIPDGEQRSEISPDDRYGIENCTNRAGFNHRWNDAAQNSTGKTVDLNHTFSDCESTNNEQPLANENFPSDPIDTAFSVDSHGEVVLDLEEELAKRIHRISSADSLNEWCLLAAAVACVSSKYTGQSACLLWVSPPVDMPRIRNGSVLPVRLVVKQGISFEEFVKQTKSCFLNANHNNLWSGSGRPGNGLDLAVLHSALHREQHSSLASLEISLSCQESTHLRLRYSRRLYRELTVSRIAGHVILYLKRVLSNLRTPVQSIPLTTVEELRLFKRVNATIQSYPRNQTIAHLVESAVRMYPQQAISCGDSSMSFEMMNRRANQLARQLLSMGISRGDLVAMISCRSIGMIVSMLAILKAGCVCVPVDRQQPDCRIANLLERSAVCGVVYAEPGNQIAGNGPKTITYSEESVEALDDADFSREADASDPAFLVFTSGSSQEPNGVLLTHRGINNHVYTKISLLNLGESDIVAHTMNIGFVASIWSVLSAIYVGANLKILSASSIHDPFELMTDLQRQSVTVVSMTPSFLQACMYTSVQKPVFAKSLRWLILTGEEVSPKLVHKLRDVCQARLLNAYGQSECSDDTMHFLIPDNWEGEIVPIGTPSNNTKAYVLDAAGELQPVGVPGQLYLCGDGVANGYYQDRELSRERFTLLSVTGKSPLFKTGDTVRWTPDGVIEFLGRADHQVKIRGFRVDTVQVERCFYQIAGVRQAAVTMETDGDDQRYLAAYLVTDGSLSVSHIQSELCPRLAPYMLPSRYVFTDCLPMTHHGKINYRELKTSCRPIAVRYDNETQSRLAAIWSQVLNIESFGPDEEFYSVGGHSLSAVALLENIRRVFGVEITYDVFQRHSTIRLMSQYLQEAAANTWTSQEF